jgi:hypothetical protein
MVKEPELLDTVDASLRVAIYRLFSKIWSWLSINETANPVEMLIPGNVTSAI